MGYKTPQNLMVISNPLTWFYKNAPKLSIRKTLRKMFLKLKS
jgi:hypothetical protein